MSQCGKLTANGGALFGPTADVKSTVKLKNNIFLQHS